MQFLTQIIYQVATALLAPVLVGLLLLLGWTLFVLGGFLREWRTRRAKPAVWPSSRSDAQRLRGAGHGGPAPTAADDDAATSGDSAEKLLVDLELAASERLAWMSFGVRSGPLLGLMGTLIPMGPALLGLSTGNLEAMAGNLVIVFSTTVVGVLIGGLCHAMLLVRRQWYARDLAELEHRLRCSTNRHDTFRLPQHNGEEVSAR